MKLQLKNSSTLSGGTALEPNSSYMLDGELAINYNSTDPRLFIKESDGTIGQVPIARSKSHFSINDEGKIGLGTTNPAEILDIRAVHPVIQMKPTLGGTHNIDAMGVNLSIEVDDDSSSSLGAFIVKVGSNEACRVGGTNRYFGIGTDSAFTQLTVHHENGSGSAIATTGHADSTTAMRVYREQLNAAAIDFGIVDSGRTYIQSRRPATLGVQRDFAINPAGGNVGIGLSEPATKLDVSGDIRSSTGILFGTDTAAANRLDDYEEGLFTPSFTVATGTITPTYDQQAGYYTKIGRVVHIRLRLRTDAIAGSGSGNLSISGLPFTPATTTNQPLAIYAGQYASADNPHMAWVSTTGSTIALYKQNQTVGNSPVRSTKADLATGSNDNTTWVAGVYEVA